MTEPYPDPQTVQALRALVTTQMPNTVWFHDTPCSCEWHAILAIIQKAEARTLQPAAHCLT